VGTPEPPSSRAVAEDLRRLGLACVAAPRLETLPGDAGARRYVRIWPDSDSARSLLLMLVPDRGDAERGGPSAGGELPYLNLQRYLARLGLPVPRVHGFDPATGRLYHEDFGSRHLAAAARDAAEPAGCYAAAVDLLVTLQARTAAPDPGCLAFGRRLEAAGIRAELSEFSEFGVGRMAGRERGPAERKALDGMLDALASEVAALPLRFNHRDFHGDNLILRPDGSLGIIDFQDAFLAPRLYDLASLLTDRDAPKVLGWEGVEGLVSRFGAAPAEFWTVALQRQMKVAGRFASLARRGKEGYLGYLPVTWSVIARALEKTGRRGLQELLASLGCPV
jgi:aminoglycoside/choline kinase family phosphotransferase